VRCELLCELAQELQFEDTGEALAASASALATARDLGDDRLLCRALNARYCATSSRSQTSELVAIGDELLEVATGRGDTGYQTLAHYVLMRAAQDRGDVPAATSHADAAVALAAGGQLAMLLAGVAVWSAVCALVEGRLEEAAAIYRRAAGDIRDAGGANADGMLVMGEFTVGYARGDTSPSLDGLVLMQEMAPGAFSDQVVLALLDAGRTEEARLAWQPGLDIPLDSCWQWATALHGDIAARIGDAATARRCYDDLLPHADAWAGMSTAALVFAPVALTLGELAMSLGDQAAADRHFAHSLRMCHAMGAERWAARTRTAAAKLAAAV
jgi:tetratricopeptide (TPR) repeat protein